MPDRRTFIDGEPRPPTWAERAAAARLQDEGVADVYLDVHAAPPGFWNTIVQATRMHLANETSRVWSDWSNEVRFAFGWEDFLLDGFTAYQSIVAEGVRSTRTGFQIPVYVGERIAAIEHALDIADPDDSFGASVNDRARHFRVGIRLDGRRFSPTTSEFIHAEIVQPALILLADPDLASVNELYRKAFDRVFAGDFSGAVTAATSAVEELLRLGLDTDGGTLGSLAQAAREDGWIIPAVEQSIVKLAALRDASDAHTSGTDSPEVAMFAVQQSAVIIRHLADTRR